MLFQLGMLAQSGDFFDIWGMVDAGSAPENHGNAGNGTYIVQIGTREGKYHLIQTNCCSKNVDLFFVQTVLQEVAWLVLPLLGDFLQKEIKRLAICYFVHNKSQSNRIILVSK